MGCLVGRTSALVCGLPFSSPGREQTKVSIGLRVTGALVGTLVLVIGLLVLRQIQGLSYLGIPGGVTSIALGGVLCLVTLALKCVKKEADVLLHDSQPVPTSGSNPIGSTDIPQSVRETCQQELEEGIAVSEETLKRLQQLMPQLHEKAEHPEIIWHAQGNNLVFALQTEPGLIFKMSRPHAIIGGKAPNQRTQERFEKMVHALAICKTNQLDCLIIPHAKLIDIQGDMILAEERLDFPTHQYAQEKLYQEWTEELDEVLTQLTVFISLTRFDDVESRNIPLITHGATKQAALIDLETLFEQKNGAKIGIIGGPPHRTGLINYLFSERQIDLVLAKASALKVLSRQDVKDAKDLRMNKLQFYQKLNQFYESQGIAQKAHQPIVIDDWDALGLDLDATCEIHGYIKELKDLGTKSITQREAVHNIVQAINKQIRQASKMEYTTQRKRYIDSSQCFLFSNTYRHLGIRDLDLFKLTSEEAEKRLWLPRIFKALIENKYLFHVDYVDNDLFYIQA